MMRKEYDFSKGRKNTYTVSDKNQTATLPEKRALSYLQHMAEKTGVPVQTLIDLNLSGCKCPSVADIEKH